MCRRIKLIYSLASAFSVYLDSVLIWTDLTQLVDGRNRIGLSWKIALTLYVRFSFRT